MHYICSDIHGQIDLYKQLLDKIELKETDTLYVIGDVIDRGPDSFGVLKDIMSRDNVEFFLGNHELMMLDYLSHHPESWQWWFHGNNGGKKTYEAFQKLKLEEQDAILAYIKHSWIQKYITVGKRTYALSHSYFIPRLTGKDIRYDELEKKDWDDVFHAVWDSPYRFWEYVDPAEYNDGCVHIIGHVPVQSLHKVQPPHYDGKLKERLINIDGGCARLAFRKEGGLYAMSLEEIDGKRKEYWITPE